MSKSKIDAASYEIEKGLYLVRQPVTTGAPPKAVETPVNHIAVIDCSGSMYSDLPRIRAQLKQRLSRLLKDGDTLSLVWFSGKGQYGALLEAEPVATLADLADVNKQIDRWLRPVGLTGFKEPLEQVEALVKDISKKNKNPFTLFFMSDGCDNQWNRADILKTVEKTAAGLASATFVEYGYYADRPLLAAMAEKAGGVHIHADAFDKYEPVFEAAMQKHPVGSKRIEVDVGGDPIGGFAFALDHDSGEITTYEASSGKAVLPENTSEIFYLSPSDVNPTKFATLPLMAANWTDYQKPEKGHEILDAAYAALSLFAVRMKPEVVYPILKALGDVHFINAFSTCFGKQKYSEFMDAAKRAAFDEARRLMDGYDPNLVPADDAFTVLDLLRVLADDAGARVLLNHPEFKYSRITRGRVDADENLTSDEETLVEAVRVKMGGEKNAKKLKDLQTEIDTLLAAKRDALKFVADEAPDGYPISNLTYNECSPNVSMLIKKTGTVDLRTRFNAAPGGEWKIGMRNGNIDAFQTHIWRNYAIVSHGLVNVEKLPVRISGATHDELVKHGVQLVLHKSHADGRLDVVIDVKPLPILNRKMVKAVSMKDIIELEYELTKARATQKVLKAYASDLFPGVKHAGFAEKYSDDGAVWLKDQGITYNGFSPKSTQAMSTDFVMGKELEVKLKGYSTMPPVAKVQEKLKAGGKLNGPETLMSIVIKDVENFLKKNPKNLHEKWLTGQTEAQIAKTRGLIWQTAQIKFSIIVGQVWFSECKSLDETSMTVKLDGQDIAGICELREIEIRV